MTRLRGAEVSLIPPNYATEEESKTWVEILFLVSVPGQWSTWRWPEETRNRQRRLELNYSLGPIDYAKAAQLKQFESHIYSISRNVLSRRYDSITIIIGPVSKQMRAWMALVQGWANLARSQNEIFLGGSKNLGGKVKLWGAVSPLSSYWLRP